MGRKQILYLGFLVSLFWAGFPLPVSVRILSSIIPWTHHLPPLSGFSNMADIAKLIFPLLQSSSCSHQHHPHIFIPCVILWQWMHQVPIILSKVFFLFIFCKCGWKNVWYDFNGCSNDYFGENFTDSKKLPLAKIEDWKHTNSLEMERFWQLPASSLLWMLSWDTECFRAHQQPF